MRGSENESGPGSGVRYHQGQVSTIMETEKESMTRGSIARARKARKVVGLR